MVATVVMGWPPGDSAKTLLRFARGLLNDLEKAKIVIDSPQTREKINGGLESTMDVARTVFKVPEKKLNLTKFDGNNRTLICRELDELASIIMRPNLSQQIDQLARIVRDPEPPLKAEEFKQAITMIKVMVNWGAIPDSD